jgi:hypothetical protein
MRFAAAVGAVSDAFGLPRPVTQSIAVSLQRARLIPVGGRGKGGRVLTPAEIAPLVIAALATDRPVAAVDLARRVAALPVVGDHDLAVSPWPAVAALPKEHSAGDLIAALLTEASQFRLSTPAPWCELRLELPDLRLRLRPTRAAKAVIACGGETARAIRGAIAEATYGTTERPSPEWLRVERAITVTGLEMIYEGAYAPGLRGPAPARATVAALVQDRRMAQRQPRFSR